MGVLGFDGDVWSDKTAKPALLQPLSLFKGFVVAVQRMSSLGAELAAAGYSAFGGWFVNVLNSTMF